MLWRKRHTVTEQSVVDGLRDIGIRDGDFVVLHSSLSSLGWVDGGPETVVDAFLEVLGEGGTLMTPTFTNCFAPRNGLKRDKQGPFDPHRTPSSTGRITETVRCRSGSFRSLHPIHSAAAIGMLAETLTRGHENACDFGPETPFGQSMRADATIVLLGVGQRVNSTLHAVEDILGMPYLEDEQALIVREDGSIGTFACKQCPTGCRDFYRGEGSKWNRAIQKSGVVRHARLARAPVQIMHAAGLAQAALDLLEADPELLLCDRPTCTFCSRAKVKVRRVGIKDPRAEV
jgi:aminoglycoside 3-N-acetyltransferase